jgi:predicted TIM-barrel fold metal-dependent hydrolase
VVEAFAPYELPILMHTGIAHYYSDEEGQWQERASYGEIHYVRNIVQAFPRVHFIVGHAGIAEVRDVLYMLV